MRSPVADKPDLPEEICLVVVEREVTNLGRALAPLHAVDMEIHTHHTQNVAAHDPQRATGIFAGAQILLDRQSVLYAWGPTSTTYTSVESRRLGMATPPSPSGARGNIQTYSTKTVTSSASTGRSRVDACPLATFTNAPDAEAKPTERANVLELRKSKALTPYHADAWEAHLHAADLDGKYPQLVFQLRYGFQAGIPKILNTFSPPNDHSLHVYTQAYNEIVAKEFASGQYVGPFSQQEVESIIGPFQSSPPSPWLRNPANLANSGQYITSPSPITPYPSNRSTSTSSHLISHACGERSALSPIPYGIYHQVPRPRSEMLQRLIALYQYTQTNGQALLYDCEKKTLSQSILTTTLASPRPVVYMGKLVMRHATFSDTTESGPFQNGLMTIYFFASKYSMSPSTILNGKNGTVQSQKTVEESMSTATSGTKVKQCQMIKPPSLMRMLHSRSKYNHAKRQPERLGLNTPTPMETSTASRQNWESPGNPQKRYLLDPKYHIWDLSGTWSPDESAFPIKRRPSTSW